MQKQVPKVPKYLYRKLPVSVIRALEKSTSLREFIAQIQRNRYFKTNVTLRGNIAEVYLVGRGLTDYEVIVAEGPSGLQILEAHKLTW